MRACNCPLQVFCDVGLLYHLDRHASRLMIIMLPYHLLGYHAHAGLTLARLIVAYFKADVRLLTSYFALQIRDSGVLVL
jgi:hypothetical protein